MAPNCQYTVRQNTAVSSVQVYSRKDRFVGVSFTDHGNLGIPSLHVPNTVLERKDEWESEDIELSLEIESGFGSLGILEADLGELRGIVDLLVTPDRCALLVAETEPAAGCQRAFCSRLKWTKIRELR